MADSIKGEKITFEEALDKTGFGVYSVMTTCVCGLTTIALVCMAFSATVIVPASACDLGTTTAQQGAMVAAPNVGVIIGQLVWGYLADTKGRKKMLMISLLGSACVNAIASLSINWIMLMILQVVTLVIASGQATIAYTIASESIPMKRRSMVMLLINSIYLIGQGTMSAVGIPILPLTFSYYLSGLDIYWTSWRTLMLTYSLPSIVIFFCLLAIKESPKFVMSQGDEAGALKILAEIHRINNGRSKEYEVTGILLEKDDSNTEQSIKDHILPLFKKPLLKSTIVMTSLYVLFQTSGSFMQWLPAISNQFFNTLQTGEGTGMNLCGMISASLDAPPVDDAMPCAIDENALLVVLVVCVMQSGLNATISLVVQYLGRRNTAIAVALIFGLCGVLVNLIPNAVGSAILFILHLMSILIVGLYFAITVALFPTQVRAVALSFVVSSGQASSFAMIQIVNLLLVNNCELGFYLLASLFTMSAGVLMLLPDDRLLAKKDAAKSADAELDS